MIPLGSQPKIVDSYGKMWTLQAFPHSFLHKWVTHLVKQLPTTFLQLGVLCERFQSLGVLDYIYIDPKKLIVALKSGTTSFFIAIPSVKTAQASLVNLLAQKHAGYRKDAPVS